MKIVGMYRLFRQVGGIRKGSNQSVISVDNISGSKVIISGEDKVVFVVTDENNVCVPKIRTAYNLARGIVNKLYTCKDESYALYDLVVSLTRCTKEGTFSVKEVDALIEALKPLGAIMESVMAMLQKGRDTI